MKVVTRPDEAVNNSVIPPGSRIYSSGNAATPLLKPMMYERPRRGMRTLPGKALFKS